MPKRSFSLASLRLKSFTEADLPFLYRVYASTRIEEVAQADWSEEQATAFLTMQFEAQHAHYQSHYPKARYDLILLKKKPIGRFYVDRGAKDILVIDIALLPEYRNLGVGGYLMRELLREAQTKGQPVLIHVERFNPALRFYDRLGFQVLEDKGVYLFLKWTPSGEPEGENRSPVVSAALK